MSRWPARIVIPAVVLLLGLPGLAHHSPVRYRVDQVVALEGTVTRVDWKNPHTYFIVEDSNGSEWRLEGGATPNMQRAGWSRSSVSAGDVVVARLNPARDPAVLQGLLLSIVTADGAVHSLAGYADAGGEAGARDASFDSLAGVWRGEGRQAFDMLFSYIDQPLTERGERARAGFDESMDPINDCETWPAPRLTAWTAFYLSAIELGDDEVVIRNEFGNTTRTIFLDGRSHPPPAVTSGQGHSVGTWQDGVLVVETTNFAPSRSPVADGIPSGLQKVVEERFALSDDGRQLHVSVVVRDPEYLAEPFTAELTWHYTPTLELAPFECDPESSGRYLQ